MILKQTIKKTFRVLCLVFAFLAVLEGLLWLVNKPSYILFTENANGFLEINRKFVKHLSVKEFAELKPFKKEKPKNTFRIFIVGEKINYQRPHNPNAGFTHILNYNLQHLFKDKNIELVNVAFDSSSSFELSRVCNQLLNYEPDLVMLCPGKDEFYGENAYPNNVLTGNPEFDNFLTRTHLYKGIRKLFPSAKSGIAINNVLFRKTVENFEINLDKIVLSLQDKSIPVILVNNVSNLLDVVPQNIGFSSPDSSSLEKVFETGEKAYSEKDYDKAYACFSKINRKEKYHPLTLFYLGHLALKNKDFKSAEDYFKQSADCDPVKLRIPTQINNAVFRIASTRNCPLIDAEKLFFQASANGIPGNELFLDEQTLNLRGNALLANGCLQTILKEGYLKKTKVENYNIASQLPITPFDSIYDQMISQSPVSQAGLIFSDVSTTFEEKMVNLFAEKKNNWEESMNKLYDYYIKNRNYRMAFKIIENLVLENPYSISLNEKASQTAAIVGDSQLVIHYASRVYKMKPSPDIAQSLVINYLKLDMPESALPYLKYIRNHNQRDFDLIYTTTNQIIDLKKLLKNRPDDSSIRARIAQQYKSIGNDEAALVYATPPSKF